MKNPWLDIQHNDYENHMTEIGQSQLLSNLTKYCLDNHKPERFVLLGCATGNGLEHVDPEITKKVYAIDINPDFLRLTLENFKSRIPDLEVVKTDIRQEEFSVSKINLLFAGLILEYVNPADVIPKLVKALAQDGILFIVIQKNKSDSFVSKTKYKSLEILSTISNEVNEEEVERLLRNHNLELLNREEIPLTELKSFVTLEYRKLSE